MTLHLPVARGTGDLAPVIRFCRDGLNLATRRASFTPAPGALTTVDLMTHSARVRYGEQATRRSTPPLCSRRETSPRRS